MVLTGIIAKAGWAKNKAKTRDVFSFTVKMDEDGKDKNIWTNDEKLQAQIPLLINKHVTIDAQEGEGGFINPIAIKESEAPKPTQSATQPVTITTNSIEYQKPKHPLDTTNIDADNALNNLTQLIIAGTVDEPLKVYVIDHLAKRIGYNAPKQPATARKEAPEGVFAGGGTEPTKKAIPQTPKEKQGQTMEPMASDRQINALMKLTHSENEVDLLTKAEVFLECPIDCLKNITMEDASNWISKLNEAKK